MKTAHLADIAVVGNGPAGLAAALALTDTGLRVALIGPQAGRPDTRTAALFAGSVHLLENLGLGPTLETAAEPIHAIRIIDDMGGIFRAPEVTFTAVEAGLARFGYNVPNTVLVAGLGERARAAGVEMVDGSVAALEIGPARVEIRLADGGRITAPLVVGADGRGSICRAAAGITVKTWTYEQSAVTTTFEHQRPHRGVSTEFHRPAGPLTVVPCSGDTSSLVWVERPQEAQRLADLGEAAFRAELESRLQGLLGTVGTLGQRGTFPLSGMQATAAGCNRIALVGEAVHVIPPIGAQGLNLGLRDVACLADCIADAHAAGEDIGAPQVLEHYEASRRTDIASRTWAVDMLNRTLLTPLSPIQALRGLGMHIFKAVGPARRAAIREGLGPSHLDPRLMRRPAAAATGDLDATPSAGHDPVGPTLDAIPADR